MSRSVPVAIPVIGLLLLAGCEVTTPTVAVAPPIATVAAPAPPVVVQAPAPPVLMQTPAPPVVVQAQPAPPSTLVVP